MQLMSGVSSSVRIEREKSEMRENTENSEKRR